jgi:hypothetical protein
MATTEVRDHRPARLQEPDLPDPAIVVVLDSRAASVDAFAWAADEARRRDRKLRVVTAYGDPDDPDAPKTVEKAIAVQHRLRRQLAVGRPWLHEACFVVRRGTLRDLLGEAVHAVDSLVVSEPPRPAA